jgi:D-serine deaminase-like pyridoxal phosphate-dependent protein
LERPIFKPVGTPVDELDTPSLVVDLDILEANIETVHGAVHDGMARLRPRVDAHCTPAIAHKQIAAGGTVGGIAVATLGQAEVFAQAGFDDILVANLVVTAPKIARLASLARDVAVTVAVDSERNVRDLSAAATAKNASVRAVVAVSTAPGRFGAPPGEAAVVVARAVVDADGVDFAGLMASEAPVLEEERDAVAAATREGLAPVLDTRARIEAAGIEVGAVIAGGSSNYEAAAATEGVTEVPAGRYALMDAELGPYLPRLGHAARVNSVVTGRPEDGLAIVDGGRKAIGSDTGDPLVDVPGAVVKGLSAEHGSLILDAVRPNLKDRVWFTPYDAAECVNLHDYMHVVRNGRLEAVWDIPARGLYR